MKQKKNLIYLSIIAILSALLILSHIPRAAIAQPGTSTDPLVTRRYVDEQIAQLQAQITALEGQITGPTQVTHSLTQEVKDAIIADILQQVDVSQVIPFTPLFVPQGSRLVTSAGVEFILRAGAANVVAGANGLVDITAGKDIANGQPISTNHLMLVPASDGRGLHFLADSWLMIKGGFIIVNE